MVRNCSLSCYAETSVLSGRAGSQCPAHGPAQMEEPHFLYHPKPVFFCHTFKWKRGLDLKHSYDLIRSWLITGTGLSKTPLTGNSAATYLCIHEDVAKWYSFIPLLISEMWIRKSGTAKKAFTQVPHTPAHCFPPCPRFFLHLFNVAWDFHRKNWN